MKHPRRTTLARSTAGIAAATVLLGVAAGGVHAQQAATQTLRPPTVNQTDDPPTIRMYLVTALLAALVVGANLTPSKRGHQD